jgi:acyl transferase domain-containing protein
VLTRSIRPAAGAANRPSSTHRLWDTEVLLFRGESRQRLKAIVQATADDLRRHPDTNLTDLAFALNSDLQPGGSRLALVAATAADAVTSLKRALQRLEDPECREIRGASGLYYASEPLFPGGKIAFLFPGEGAQYLGMLGDVRQAFPEVATFFAECDAMCRQAGDDGPTLTQVFLPPDDAGPDDLAHAKEELRRIDHAMLSVMMADWALYLVLERLGLSPDVVAGHSMGELVALWAAGCVEAGEGFMLPLIRETMEVMRKEEESAQASYVLLAVGAGRKSLAELIAALGEPPIVIAMDNCPRQTVVVGPPEPMASLEAELQRRRVLFERLPFHRPYHTPLFAPMIQPVRELFQNYRFRAPRRPVYSCTTARPFPDDPEAIRELAIAHWAEPVRFSELIRNLHDDGVRLFVESGPRGNLCAFTEDVLGRLPCVAMPANVPRRSGLTQLNHLLGGLWSHHVPVELAALYEHRAPRQRNRPSGAPASRRTLNPAEPVERRGGEKSSADETQQPPSGERFSGAAPAGDSLPLAKKAEAGVMTPSPENCGASKHTQSPPPPPAPSQGAEIVRPKAGEDPESPQFPLLSAPPERPRREVSAAVQTPRAPESTAFRPGGHLRSRVMARHLEVMEQFLDHQREVTELFLNRTRRQREALSPPAPVEHRPTDAEAGPTRARPLLGALTHHEPGRTLVLRRVLDLRDDHFATHHTVGGREISKIDPEQYGVPVMPMTFTLEMMAEAASVLVPGQVVTSVRGVRLYRWLAYSEEAPTVVELTARAQPRESNAGPWHVTVEVKDLGLADRPKETAWLAAEGTVVLASAYPPAPPCLPFRLTNERVATLTVERTYHNLFHGPLFQGVQANLRSGDEGMESRVVVLPRDRLFRPVPEPEFLIDPVLFDVVLHPLAAWHLIQPDQAGRIMLPIGVESLDVFGPPLAPGTTLTARSWVTRADARSFLHQGEALTDDGSVALRLTGVKCWRFYVPFGQVNFHGPKDQYFLSHRWHQVEERCSDVRRPDAPLALVRLEPPVDLNQGSMLQVTAKVTLTPSELREYRRLEAEGDEAKLRGWLFDRNVAKDAIRLVWHDMTGERLFPADIEVETVADGRFAAHRRGDAGQSFPPAGVDRAGSATVAISAAGASVLGIALAIVGTPNSDGGAICPLDADEERLLATFRGDRAEASLRLQCARRAVARAAGLARPDELDAVRVRGILGGTGTVLVAVVGHGDGGGPNAWRAETARDGNLIVAWTKGQREVS